MFTVGRLISFFTGHYGGPYNHIMELTLELEKMGINTRIFSTSFIDKISRKRTEFFEQKSDKTQIYRFHSLFKFREYRISLKFVSYLLREAKNIDIFHSHSMRSYQEDIGALVSIIKKKPFILTPHGGISINWDYSDKIPKLIHDKTMGYIRKKLLNPHFVAVAKNEILRIRKYKIDDDHIHYIPHGVNTELFKPVNSDDLKKEYNLEGCDLILYVGRIAKGKHVDKLIKILNFIVQKKKNVRLMIVGEDSGYLHIVRSLIRKYNLSKYVIFVGFIAKNFLPKYYSMADLVVYPSIQEIFGHVLIEAGACGKAVMGGNIMGPAEIIDNGVTGYTSNFMDLKELSNKILNLLNDKNLLNQMGKNARKRVIEKYSWEKAANSHKKLYMNVLNLK